MNILVAYETVHGSTRSIAENIGRSLAAHYRVTTCPMAAVGDIREFDAFVLGSAETGDVWVPAARAFLQRHADELAAKPVWMFSVGISDALPRPLRWAARRGEERKLLGSVPSAIRPRGVQVFTGIIRRDQLASPVDRFWMRAGGIHDADLRRWPEIMTWAGQIRTELAELQAA